MDLPCFVLDRDFSAPPERVFQAWTDPALFARWYGPGAQTTILSQDIRTGGSCQIEMRWGGRAQYQQLDYRDVTAPTRLVFVVVTCDANWTPAAPPHAPDWPTHLLTDISFAATAHGTQLHLTWTPHAANAAQIAMFRGAMATLGRGWGAGFDLLDAILAERVT